MSKKLLPPEVAITTRSSRGICRAISRMMADHGAKVVVNDRDISVAGGRGDAHPAVKVVKAVDKAGGQAVALFQGVADFNGTGRIVSRRPRSCSPRARGIDLQPLHIDEASSRCTHDGLIASSDHTLLLVFRPAIATALAKIDNMSGSGLHVRCLVSLRPSECLKTRRRSRNPIAASSILT